VEVREMVVGYTFLSVFWDLLLLFAWIVWFWLLITVFADLFRRHDISGWGKGLWIVFLIILPYIGVLVYLIAQHDGMAQRNIQQVQQSQQQFDSYVRSVAATDPADQISKAKSLLDSGAISQAEFDQLKQKALAGSS
jgi:Short C-terminal domain/Phospholipase_D-nuclease N-terminal